VKSSLPHLTGTRMKELAVLGYPRWTTFGTSVLSAGSVIGGGYFSSVDYPKGDSWRGASFIAFTTSETSNASLPFAARSNRGQPILSSNEWSRPSAEGLFNRTLPGGGLRMGSDFGAFGSIRRGSKRALVLHEI
jgi:hypothetical protein